MAALSTIRNKKEALAELAKRQKINKTRKRVDNASLPAGSPMYFYCLSCGDDIVVPENYVTRPSLCPECRVMKDLGWLE